MLGQRIRFLREQQALSQEELANKAGISLDTLRDIERSLRKPRGRTIRKISAALGVKPQTFTSVSSPAFSPERILAKRTSFIPLFIGDVSLEDCVRHFFETKSPNCEVQSRSFEDGYLVIIRKEHLCHKDVIETLKARRELHQGIVALRDELQTAVPLPQTHPLFLSTPPGIDYVMSTYQLLNAHDHPISSILALCKPSVIGITDDPNCTSVSDHEAHTTLSTIDLISCRKGVYEVSTGERCFYLSWSNVVLADSDLHSAEYRALEDLEGKLQKLWYQLNALDTYIGNCLCKGCTYDMETIMENVSKLQFDVLEFCKVNARGSEHMNRLKEGLIKTSCIRELLKSLNEKTEIIRSRK